jgi:hypothetical protein
MLRFPPVPFEKQLEETLQVLKKGTSRRNTTVKKDNKNKRTPLRKPKI